MSKITGKEYPLLNIFSQEFDFHIPEYQRPYAWTSEESGILFDDLYAFYMEEQADNYFLGSTVLIKEDNVPHADVIDGQQRLTTLTILFACLAQRLRNNPEAYAGCQNLLCEPGNILAGIPARPRIHLRELDQAFFYRYIQKMNIPELLALDPQAIPTEAQRNIQTNCFTLGERLDQAFNQDEEALIKFSQFLLNRCFLVTVYTPDQDSAFRIFSVMNSRGLDLLPIDIIKSEIIGKLDQSERRAYTDKWEKLENDCGRDGFNEVFTHTRSIFAKERPRTTLLEEFREYVLKDHAPKELIDRIIEPYSRAYVQLKQQAYVARSHSGEVNDVLYWLNKLNNYDWMPSAMKFFVAHGNEPAYVLWFVQKLERLAAYLLATSKDVNQRFDRYKWVLAEMDSRPTHSLAHPLVNIELTPEERKDFLDVLNGEIYTMQALRRNYLIQRIDSFYSDGGARYDTKIFTIEHVLPQTVQKDSEWDRVWPDMEKRAFWLNRLANLIPLTRRINSAAQNYDFAVKKTKYFLGTGGTSSFCLSTQIVNYATWTADDCEKRQKELLEKVSEKWDLAVTEEELNVDPVSEIFHIASRGSDAVGRIDEEGNFVVLKGSIVTKDTLSSLRGNYDGLRERLFLNGTIVENVFVRDCPFDSVSAAAAVILGRAANGPREWSTLDGREYAKVIGH